MGLRSNDNSGRQPMDTLDLVNTVEGEIFLDESLKRISVGMLNGGPQQMVQRFQLLRVAAQWEGAQQGRAGVSGDVGMILPVRKLIHTGEIILAVVDRGGRALNQHVRHQLRPGVEPSQIPCGVRATVSGGGIVKCQSQPHPMPAQPL